MSTTFGRTNRSFPNTWLSLLPPAEPDQFAGLAQAAAATRLPLEVTHAVSVWGAHLPEDCGPLVAFLGRDFALARSRDDACDLVSAQIVQVLSSLRVRKVTMLFLPVKDKVEEFQFDGALQALESARQDGLVEFTGLSCEGVPRATLGVWQFRDAFEALCVQTQDALDVLGPLADERRVGVVTTFESSHTCLVPVRSVQSVLSVGAAVP